MGEDRELVMLRVHARAAADYIEALTNFVRDLSKADTYSSDDAGDVLFAHDWQDDAKKLVCYVADCTNRPGNSTPDGRWFCGQHAHVMD